MIAKDAVGDFLRLPLLVPLIPSGSSATLTFHFLLPSNVPDSFVLTAIGESQSPASGAGAYVDEAIAAAQTYLAQEFGLAVPPSMANELRDYASAQLSDVIASGAASYAQDQISGPRLYSSAQLELDIAMFAAQRFGNATPLQRILPVH